MNIRILSRYEMYTRKVDPELLNNFKVISINDPGDPLVFQDDPRVLSLVFHDVEPDQNIEPIFGKSCVLFDEDHAEAIIDFLGECSPLDNLLVHCFAGISRSGAVGTFAREMFNVDYDRFRSMNPRIVPNTHILRTLSDTYMRINGETHFDFSFKPNIITPGASEGGV